MRMDPSRREDFETSVAKALVCQIFDHHRENPTWYKSIACSNSHRLGPTAAVVLERVPHTLDSTKATFRIPADAVAADLPYLLDSVVAVAVAAVAVAVAAVAVAAVAVAAETNSNPHLQTSAEGSHN
jgi:hypothetical protein